MKPTPETIKAINLNFFIRIRDKENNWLRGAGQYHKVVGEELAYKHFERVLLSPKDLTTIKLRRGLRIDFVAK